MNERGREERTGARSELQQWPVAVVAAVAAVIIVSPQSQVEAAGRQAVPRRRRRRANRAQNEFLFRSRISNHAHWATVLDGTSADADGLVLYYSQSQADREMSVPHGRTRTDAWTIDVHTGLFNVSLIFSCGSEAPATLVELNVLLSFFLLSVKLVKEGQNSPNKHGSIGSLGHKFQI